jgi:hypothetical protein
MCGYACALCVWQGSQDRAVFGADTSRHSGPITAVRCVWGIELSRSETVRDRGRLELERCRAAAAAA